MKPPVIEEIIALKEQPLEALRTRYSELFPGEPAPTHNKVFIWRKIAYRLQEIEHGGLSETAQTSINQLIERYDPVNNKTVRPYIKTGANGKTPIPKRDRRLPIPGAVIRKEYKGRMLEVTVKEKGFEFEGKPYKTLSSLASSITGDHWNGYNFFRI